MNDININEVYEELKYLGELPETSRLIKGYLALREENTNLRALVGELADALLAAGNDTCDYCKKHLNIGEASALICLHNRQCNVGLAYGRLVAKAREVVK